MAHAMDRHRLPAPLLLALLIASATSVWVVHAQTVLNALIESGHIGQLPGRITTAFVGSRKLDVEHDVQATSWATLQSKLLVYGFEADADSVRQMNAELAEHPRPWEEQHFDLALSDTVGDATVYVTAEAQCSSLLPPNTPLAARFHVLHAVLAVRRELPVRTTTLDVWADLQRQRTGLAPRVDFLQVDVQGLDLAVLQGSRNMLKQVLVVQVEVEFHPLYAGQPLFGDVDAFMRAQGFILYDLKGPFRFPRRASPFVSASVPGQVMASDAVYVRDFTALNFSDPTTAERLLRLAAVSDAVGLSDYAFEALTVLHRRFAGGDSRYDMRAVLTRACQLAGLDVDDPRVQQALPGVGMEASGVPIVP